MLEACPKKHMILGIVCLTLITVLVLIVESRWTNDKNRQSKEFIVENNSTCWLREEYTVIRDCHPCTAFEIASKSLGVCVHTHNKEFLRCKSGETVSRSCDRVAWVDQRKFWIFEVVLFIVGLLASMLSMIRQKYLDRITSTKIQRQLNQKNIK